MAATLDPVKLCRCATREQNDVGNAERLSIWFREDFVNVDIGDSPNSSLGVHAWVGTHWDGTIGYRTLQRFAQITAKRIHLRPKSLNIRRASARPSSVRARLSDARRKANRTLEEVEAVLEGGAAVKASEVAPRCATQIREGVGQRIAPQPHDRAMPPPYIGPARPNGQG